jgi:hypothetical protein
MKQFCKDTCEGLNAFMDRNRFLRGQNKLYPTYDSNPFLRLVYEENHLNLRHTQCKLKNDD